MLAHRLDIFSRRHRSPIEPGATYCRRQPDATVEVAKVHSIGKDEMGIDHVRYHVQIHRGQTAFVDEERILNLQTFAERYNELVPA